MVRLRTLDLMRAILIEAARAVCPAVQDCLTGGSDGDGGAVVSCLI